MVMPRVANQATARRRTPVAVCGGFVVVDLGVADPGVVVDHGVHERVAHLRVGSARSWACRLSPPGCGRPGRGRRTATHRRRGCCRTSSRRRAASRRGAGARSGVLAPRWRGPRESAGSAGTGVGLGARSRVRPRSARRAGPDPSRLRSRNDTIRFVTAAHVLVGLWCGREDRSVIACPAAVPVGPPLHGRPRALEPSRDLRDRNTLVDDEPSDHQPRARGQGSVSVGHEGLLVVKRILEQFHSTAGGPPMPVTQTSASHSLDQRPRSVHLEVNLAQVPYFS